MIQQHLDGTVGRSCVGVSELSSSKRWWLFPALPLPFLTREEETTISSQVLPLPLQEGWPQTLKREGQGHRRVNAEGGDLVFHRQKGSVGFSSVYLCTSGTRQMTRDL